MSDRGYGLPTAPAKGGTSFIFIAVAIILVFVVLYYSYNFLFNKIGIPVPSVIIGNAVSAASKPSIDASFTPPYEGGDYTITFWMYVNSNNFSSGIGNYRKHIVSIGGPSITTVTIGLDATVNNLIVRTHTGAADVSGVSSSTSTSTSTSTTSTTSSGTGGSCPYRYSAGGQTWVVPCAPGACATAGAGACTPIGRINRCSGKNEGWDASCNPCNTYWKIKDSTAGTGSSNEIVNQSYTTSGANVSPCPTNSVSPGGSPVCIFNNSTKSFTNAPTLVIGGEAARGTGGGTPGGGSPNICTWSGGGEGSPGGGTESFISQEEFTTEEPELVRENFASAGCESTSTLNTATMKSLFDTPVAVPCTDSILPGCDAPQYDLQRWTHVTVVLSGKITDVYMNGKMTRSCISKSYFKVDTNTQISVLNYKTFNGKLSDLHTYTVALNPAQIYDMYSKGPSVK